MSILRRRSVRVMGIVLGILVLAALGVKIFLPAEKIRDLALVQARAKLGREVTVGEVGVSFRGGLGVKLKDFAVHNPDGFPGDPFLKAGDLDLKLAIKPLFKREIRVDRLVLDAPVLNLSVLADSTNNFTFEPTDGAGQPKTAPAGGEGAAAPPAVSVASLEVRNGQISYADATAAESGFGAFNASDLALDLSLIDPAPGRYQMTGKLKAGSIDIPDQPDLPDLNGTLDFDLAWDNAASRLEITRAGLDVLGIQVDGSGQIKVTEGTPTGSLEFKMPDQPVVRLLALAPADIADKVKGGDDSGTASAAMQVELTGNPDQPATAKGSLQIRGADLSLAQPFMPPEQKGRVAGRGDLDLEFSQIPGKTVAFDYVGSAKFKDVSFVETGLVDELQNLNGRVRFTPTVITVENCRAEFASGTFDLTGILSDPFPYFLPPEMQTSSDMKIPHLNFELKSPRLDVDRLIPAASPSGGEVARSDGSRTEEKLAGMEFPGLTSSGTFKADTLIYMKVPFTQVTGKVNLKDRVLKCSDVKGAVYKGTVTGEVAIDLKNLQSPVYTGKYQAADIEVNNFTTRFASLAGVLFGRCNMDGSFSAKGLKPDAIRNSLTLNSDAALKDGKVITSGNVHSALSKLASGAGQSLDQEQALKDLATHIQVKDGRVGLNDLKTRLGSVGDLTFSGSYGFAGDLNYSGNLLLTKAETDRLFASGVMAELAKLLGSQRPERLGLPLTVGGTRTDPKVKFHLDTVTKDLQQRAVKEQGQKLEDEAKDKLNDLLNKWK